MIITAFIETALHNAMGATMLALGVALATRLVRHPAVHHALWLIVLLRLVMPPALMVPILPSGLAEGAGGLFARGATAGEAEAVSTSNAGAPTSSWASRHAGRGDEDNLDSPLTTSLTRILLGAWIVGSLAMVALMAVRSRRASRQLAAARPAPRWLERRVEALWAHGGRPPAVAVIDAPISPLLWPRRGRMIVVLPTPLLATLDGDELDAVLAHELAHLQRRDHWIRPLELLAVILYWWHPVVWWARAALRGAEERACDVWVAHRLPGRGRAYAESLLKAVELITRGGHAVPAAATGIAPRDDLEERLTMIVTERTPTILPRRARWALVLTGLILLLVMPTGADGPTPSETADMQAAFEAEMQARDAARQDLEERGRALEAHHAAEAQDIVVRLRAQEQALHRKQQALHRTAQDRVREIEDRHRALEAEVHRAHRDQAQAMAASMAMREREHVDRTLAEVRRAYEHLLERRLETTADEAERAAIETVLETVRTTGAQLDVE